MKVQRSILAILLLSALLFPAPGLAEPVAGRTSFGIRFGDQMAEGYLDLLLPVVGTANDLLFFNPRFGLGDEAANELNLGLGYRHSFGARGIVGGNFYFDSRRTQHDNRFSQVGLGLEYLSTWVDARGNFYWPVDDAQLADTEVEEGVQVVQTEKTSLTYAWSDPYAVGEEIRQDANVRVDTAFETTTTTTTKTFEDWESARQGFDAEIGFRVPLFGMDVTQPTPALRLFGGYYHFEDDFDAVLEGPKGRLEFRALPFLTFDVEVFQDKNLYGSRTIAGARLHTPFDIAALFHGRNPFPAAAAANASRMNEMVMRDVRVQTDTSGLAENQNLRQVEVETTIERKKDYVKQQYVLLDDVVFVDGDNATDPGQDGTAEHPFSQVQEGAGNVFGLKNLYVFAAAGNYVENVVLLEGTTMIGQGTPILGQGGKVFGGDTYPVIAPETESAATISTEAVVTLANNTTITGFTIEQGLLGIAGLEVSGAITVDNNNVVGPGLANIVVATSGDAEVNITGNYASGAMVGIGLLNLGGNLSAQVNDNEVTNASIGIGAANLGEIAVQLDLANLAPLAALAPPVVAAPATTTVTAARNLVEFAELGIGVALAGEGEMNATIDGNEINHTMIGILGMNLGRYSYYRDLIGAPPVGTLSLTATNNRLTSGSGFEVGPGGGFIGTSTTLGAPSPIGYLGIGVIGGSEGTTNAVIGGSGAGNSIDGFLFGISIDSERGFKDPAADAATALKVPISLGKLDASVVGNTVTGAAVMGIGVSSDGYTAASVQIDGNTVVGDGIGLGIGLGSIGIGLPFDQAAAQADSTLAKRRVGAPLDVMATNNHIVSNAIFGVLVVADREADMNVTLGGNVISGMLGVYAWTEDIAHLDLTLESGNIVKAVGPAIVVGADGDSNLNFTANDNTVTSELSVGLAIQSDEFGQVDAELRRNTIASFGPAVFVDARGNGQIDLTAVNNDVVSGFGDGFDLTAYENGVVAADVMQNNIDVAGSEIRGTLFNTGTIDLAAFDNVGADRSFNIDLFKDTIGGTFLATQSGNTDADGDPALMLELGPGW